MPIRVPFKQGIFRVQLFCVLIICQGCGYHLGGFRENIPAEIRTIAVPLFANHTQEPRIENFFTDAFRDQFYRLSSLHVTSQKDQADAFLQGEIIAASIEPISFSGEFVALEYLARVTISLQLKKAPDGKLLWSIDRVEDMQYFMATSDALLFNDNRDEAYLKIARRLSERAIDQILMGF